MNYFTQIGSVFSDNSNTNLKESFSHKEGTSFRINYSLFARVMSARDIMGHDHIADHIKEQLANHSAITVKA